LKFFFLFLFVNILQAAKSKRPLNRTCCLIL